MDERNYGLFDAAANKIKGIKRLIIRYLSGILN